MNKKNKLMLMLSVICVLLLIMGTASAADDDINTSLTDSNTEKVMALQDSVDKENTVSGDALDDNTDMLIDDGYSDVGSFSELEQYIKDNKGYEKTVYLNKDYAFNIETDGNYNSTGIYIGSYSIIDGQGHTIDAKNANYIFNTLGKYITLKNINFINTTSDVIKVGSSDVSIINCTFNYTGRGVSVTTSGLNCIINNCKFENGRGVYTVATGTLIKNSLFKNNDVGNGGGIYVGSDYVIIENCNFINNSATNGGAIYFNYDKTHAVLNVENCEFINNSALRGGAIYTPNAKIELNSWISNNNTINVINSLFNGNKAVQYCDIGGPELNNDTSAYNIINSTFMNRQHYDEIDEFFDGIWGGEVNLTNKTYTLSKGSIFINNPIKLLTINGNGAIIDANGFQGFNINCINSSGVTFNNLTIINSNNTAVFLQTYKATVTFNHCNFINCHSNNNGGAFRIYRTSTGSSNPTKLNDCNFINVSAASTGGVIWVQNTVYLDCLNCNFINCYAQEGGVEATTRHRSGFTNCTFENISAINCGIIKYGINEDKNRGFKNCTFINIYADSNPISNMFYDLGGNNFTNCTYSDFYEYFANITNHYIELNNNTYGYASSISLNNVTVNGNKSTIIGINNNIFSAVSSTIANMTFINTIISLTNSQLINCTFINCTSPVKVEGYLNSNISNVEFINCSDPVYIDYYGATVNITNVTIDGVKYYDDFTAKYILESNTNLTLPEDSYNLISTFMYRGINNVTIDGNGQIFNALFSQSLFQFSNCQNIIIKNFIIKNASDAFYCRYQNYMYNNINFTFLNCSFYDCKNAITLLQINGHNIIKDCSFYNCYGRSIYTESPTDIINCTFENSAITNNGVIYVGTGDYLIENCTFTNLVSLTGNGGALYVFGNLNVTNCTFVNCNAISGGSIYQSNSISILTVTNSSFDGGNAYSTGGCIYCEGTLIINGCEFTNNTADNCAGFISSNGLTLTNSNFTDNDATIGGAGSVDGDNTLISGCNFIHNNAVVGGGLNLQGDNGTISGCDFIIVLYQIIITYTQLTNFRKMKCNIRFHKKVLQIILLIHLKNYNLLNIILF